ncbi:5'-nucleotidase C-terminal domain-containing protein [Mesobacillus maritimus]|uniref:5'-nucleotidase C-terminal domain-containing protein n=1 Tax=Mesobacillus maritimus TaxID=1643336 RepID=A0ABS7K4E6_9BACI|nr:5'-nucleotidase C-terminal domain-containing protein [Mesobacillus maritimus]MBY0097138.1 5'-nucleotidase C-terminal domain-containing protein [Mesobacillus maritimus]
MNILKKKWFIFTAVFALLVGYITPFAQVAHAEDGYITVEEAIANNSGVAVVKGYIVGTTKGNGGNYQHEGTFSPATNIAIADDVNERDPAKILPVQLPAGAVRSALNLVDNPELLGKEVYLTGTLEAYFSTPGLKNISEYSFDGVPEKPPIEGIEGLKINEIQGADHNSPYKGQNVIGVEGIVTFVDDASNFYLQDPNPDDNSKTSEGILIYKKNHGVSVGDHVSVDGLVKEWVLEGYSDMLETDLATTEIDANNGSVTVVASNQDVPAPLVIGKDIFPPTDIIDNDQFAEFDPEQDGIDFYESIEGMLVAVENPVAVGPQKYGEVPVIAEKVEGKTYTTPGGLPLQADNSNPERLHLLFDDNDYVAKIGDRFDGTVEGVVTYTFQNFKILTDADALPELVESDYKQEVAQIAKKDDKLTIATYNMENYHAGETAKTEKISKSIVTNLNSPDILGLVEVQDNDGPTDSGTVEASKSYETLIAAIEANGGPAYKWTDIAPEDKVDGGQPGGNIRVGFLYNPERVSLAEAEKGSATQAVGYENGSLTLNPGRIDPTNAAFESSRKPLAAQFEFNGEDVIVINNHFNSKGGDQPIFGKNQPPVLGSEAQRVEIASIVNGFIKDVQSENPNANVVVMGDLNDFEFSNPIQTLKGSELTNLIEMVPAAERFTYNYQGNSQVLDHILVTNNLAAGAEVDIVHINSPFMEEHGRASDHDPVLTQLDLTTDDEEAPFSLSIMHVNDSHAHVEQYPMLTTAVKEVRAENPEALLLDAGDVFSGTLYFNQYAGLADLHFMNELGYDAMTFGNHEFDKDSKVLADFVKEMKFPLVSANVNVSADVELGSLFKNEISSTPEAGTIYPAIIKEVDGEQVGIFGLTTEETPTLASPSKEIIFEDSVEKATKTVEALEGAGVNKIIALSHLGYGPDKNLASEVDGIDVIVGGHSHTTLTSPEVIQKDEPTVIVQANEYLNYLGLLDVTFDENGVVTGNEGELIDLGEFEADEAAQAKVEEFAAPLEELKQTVIGYTEVALDGERANVRTQETNLGNLITDAMLAKAKTMDPDTTIALQNGGGIRASIDQGEVTLGEVLTVQPFGNLLVTLDLTGEEIVQALEHSVNAAPEQSGGFLQVSGLQFKYDPTKPAYDRVWSVEVQTENGLEALDLTKTYTVATNAFTADGGDGYGMFKTAKDEGRINELLIVDYEILSEYFEMNSPISPVVQGRIVASEEQQVEPPKSIEEVLVDLDESMDEYAASGELTGPLLSQLTNTHKQAENHWNKGSVKNSLKFMNKYLDQLNHKTKQKNVSAEAKKALTEQAELLIEMLEAK